MKKGEKDLFDVTMRSYHAAEVCELVSITKHHREEKS